MSGRKAQGIDFSGDLQSQVMTAIWRLGEATVDDVLGTQPRRGRPAYTTVQTVMSRLWERGLLERERRGQAFVYRPKLDEGSYLAKTIARRLEGASPEARRAALVNLVGELDPSDLDELAKYANKIRRARGK